MIQVKYERDLRAKCNFTDEDRIDMTMNLINIAEDFNEWLKEMASKYGTDKDEIQLIIKFFLS